MKNKFVNTGCLYIILFFITALCYLLGRVSGLAEHVRLTQIVMTALLIGCVMVVICRNIRGNYSERDLITGILFAGCVMRIGYMIYTPCNVRGHDLWKISEDSYGHAAYILNLLKLGRLPQTNEIQFYQQPFFYLMGSAVSAVINGILSCKDSFYLVDATKVVSCTASCATLLLVNKVSEFFSMKPVGKIMTLSIVAFLPAFYLAGGRVSPDALTGFFMTLAFYYTLRWYQNPGWKETVLLALVYGMAMMTKLSCGVLALFTATLFVIKLFQNDKTGTWFGLLKKYLLFAGISLPLGLWYTIRNYIRFAQPIGYVPRLSEDSGLYTGDIPLTDRIVKFDFANLLREPYARVHEDFNAPAYYLKSSLFGEFTFEAECIWPCMLLAAAFGLSVYAIILFFLCVRKEKRDWPVAALIFCTILYYISSLYFYVKYPFGCSMDYRYMLFLTVPMSVIIGKGYEKMKCVWCRGVFKLLVVLYAVSSCMMYLRIAK